MGPEPKFRLYDWPTETKIRTFPTPYIIRSQSVNRTQFPDTPTERREMGFLNVLFSRSSVKMYVRLCVDYSKYKKLDIYCLFETSLKLRKTLIRNLTKEGSCEFNRSAVLRFWYLCCVDDRIYYRADHSGLEV